MEPATRPHLLYLHQHFRWPEDGGGLRSYYVARELEKAGWKVTIVAAPVGTHPEYETRGDITVVRAGRAYAAGMGFWQRMGVFLSYVLHALAIGKGTSASMVYATSTPLTVGLVALFLGKPFVFEERDPWPAVPLDMGFIRSGNPLTLGWWAELLASLCHAGAMHSVLLSPAAVVGTVSRGLAWRRFLNPIPSNAPIAYGYSICPNYFGAKEVNSQPKFDRFTFIYGGAIGPANDPEKLAALFQLLAKHLPECRLLLVPEQGRALPPVLQTLVEAGAVTREEYKNKGGYEELLQRCHMVIVCFADYPSLQAVSPNKFYEAVSLGLPTLLAMAGPISDEVRRANAGLTIQYLDDNELSRLVTYVRDNLAYDTMTNAVLSMRSKWPSAQVEISMLLNKLWLFLQ